MSALVDLVSELQEDRSLTSKVFFSSRHQNEDAPFHPQMMEAIAGRHRRVLIKAFRGAAKSTIAEEALLIEAVFNLCQFGLIIGSTYDRACERLATIRYELENNEKLLSMFRDLRGTTWGADVLVLGNGVRLQALGRGQSMRGAKEVARNMRPDFVLVDDLETQESVDTTQARNKVWRWFMREMIPALDPTARIRVLGTPLHEASLIERLSRSNDWMTLNIPIYTMGEDKVMVPAWSSRFPLSEIAALKDGFDDAGDLAGFSQEFLCTPIDDSARSFRHSDIRIVEQLPQWAPKMLIVDPARTTGPNSARTGYVVCAWVGTELYIFDAIGATHSPSDQVQMIFSLWSQYHPMLIAVELDGLEQWLTQPLRDGMLSRGLSLPLKGIRAPRDKKSFILGLEPFFRAGEVKMVKPIPDLERELLGFPFGKIDVLNALAYAVTLRPGAPVYPQFTQDHVAVTPDLPNDLHSLVINAYQSSITGVLLSLSGGRLKVQMDWVMEESVDASIRAMRMNCAQMGYPATVMIPYERNAPTDYSGIGNCLRRQNTPFRVLGKSSQSEGSLTDSIRHKMISVHPKAWWTLNALAGGYCRSQYGRDVSEVQPSIHAAVAQSIECFVSQVQPDDESRANIEYATTTSGRRYISMLR